MVNSPITYSPTFKGLPILTDEASGLGCYSAILDATYHTMLEAKKLGQPIFIRLDLRFPQQDYICNTANNTKISTFINNFIKHFKRYGHKVAKYIWVREQSKEKHQHYHCVLLLDNKQMKCTADFNHIFQRAEELWAKALGINHLTNNGLIDRCNKDRGGGWQKNGLVLYHNNPERFAQAFQWASYLAKVNTKNHVKQYVNSWSSSSY